MRNASFVKIKKRANTPAPPVFERRITMHGDAFAMGVVIMCLFVFFGCVGNFIGTREAYTNAYHLSVVSQNSDGLIDYFAEKAGKK